MSNKHEQRLEELEEVIQRTLNKVQELENRKIELPGIPDYTSQFNELKESIARHNLAYPVVRIQTQILELKKNIDAIPKRIPIQHYYHFTDRSKGSIIAGMTLLIVCAVSVGIAISMWKENRKLSKDSIRFRLMREVYPKATRRVDSIYYKNPTVVEQWVDSLQLNNK